MACTSSSGHCYLSMHCFATSLQEERPATLTVCTWIPCHSGFLFMFDSNSIAIQFCCRGSIMLLAAESLLIHLICPIDLPNLRTVLFPPWSVFLQAKSSKDIKDQPIIVFITIIKIYLLYFKMSAEKHIAFIYSDIQIFLLNYNSFVILASPCLVLSSGISNLVCESHSFFICKRGENTPLFRSR